MHISLDALDIKSARIGYQATMLPTDHVLTEATPFLLASPHIQRAPPDPSPWYTLDLYKIVPSRRPVTLMPIWQNRADLEDLMGRGRIYLMLLQTLSPARAKGGRMAIESNPMRNRWIHASAATLRERSQDTFNSPPMCASGGSGRIPAAYSSSPPQRLYARQVRTARSSQTAFSWLL